MTYELVVYRYVVDRIFFNEDGSHLIRKSNLIRTDLKKDDKIIKVAYDYEYGHNNCYTFSVLLLKKPGLYTGLKTLKYGVVINIDVFNTNFLFEGTTAKLVSSMTYKISKKELRGVI